MLKAAIVLLCITLAIANIASRFIPHELRRAARILSWLLGAYVVFMLTLGVIASFNAHVR